MHMEVFSLNTIDTIAERIVARVKESGASGVALKGNLGAGKTTLAQAIGKVLGVSSPIISPTFILVKRYDTHGVPWHSFTHCDAYRIDTETEARGLRLDQYKQDFFCIEWPERLCGQLPERLVHFELSYVSEDKRGIIGL